MTRRVFDTGHESLAQDSAARPSELEREYVSAMSRSGVVDAYSSWSDISRAEEVCLREYVKPGCRVLDLGCGTGRVLGYLEEVCQSYLGVDASGEMVAAARARYPGFDFVVGDILYVPGVVEDSFDAVLLMHNVLDTLHPIQRRSLLLGRCLRWLPPDGVLVCSSHTLRIGQSGGYYAEDYHGVEVYNYRSALSEFVHELEDSGFETLFAMCDFRGGVADWAYTVSRPLR